LDKQKVVLYLHRFRS